MWKQIKILVLNKKEQVEYSDNCDIVNEFNTFFIDIVINIRQLIDKVQYVSQLTCEPSYLNSVRQI